MRLPWVSVPPLGSGFCRDVGGGFVFVWLFGVGVAFAFLGLGGGGAGEGCWCRRGSPALAGRAVREPPLRRGVGGAEVRVAEGGVPACAGTTGGVRVGDGGRGGRVMAGRVPRVGGGAPSTGSGRTDLGSASAVKEKVGEGRATTRVAPTIGVARGGDTGWLRLWYICSILDVIQLRTGVRRSGVWTIG